MQAKPLAQWDGSVPLSHEEQSAVDEARGIFDIERDEVIGVGTLEGRPFTAIDPEPVIRRLLH